MKSKYLFEVGDGSGRKCYLNDDGLIHIESNNNSDFFKSTYDAFVDDYKKLSLLWKVRNVYHQMQANIYIKGRSLLQTFTSWLLPYIPKIYKYGNFLDVGCNTGSFLSKLSPEWKKFGVEVNIQAYNMCKEHKDIQVFNVPLEKFDTTLKFDFIRLSHVVEHIKDYDKFIQKVFDLMNDGSYALFYTPNTKSISYLVFKDFWVPLYEKTHAYLFNIENFKKCLVQHGFSISTSGTYYMGTTAGSIINWLRLSPLSFLYKPLFYFLFVSISPFSFIVNFLKLGGAQYIYAYRE